MCLAGCKQNAAKRQAGQETVIYFFHNNPCESCHEDEKFREMVRDDIVGERPADAYRIEAYYAYSLDARDRLEELMKEYNISKEEITYPFAAVDGHFLYGYEEIEEELYQYLSSGTE